MLVSQRFLPFLCLEERFAVVGANTPHQDSLLHAIGSITREPEKGQLCSVWDSVLFNSVVQVDFLSHLWSHHLDATKRPQLSSGHRGNCWLR